eukprot:COSAG02_NODE_58153_length_278_cov_0.810056_1_plen_31_part_01
MTSMIRSPVRRFKLQLLIKIVTQGVHLVACF